MLPEIDPVELQAAAKELLADLERGVMFEPIFKEDTLFNPRSSDKEFSVNKARLLGVLQENRIKHKENFTLAMRGYRAAMVQELEKKLAAAREDKDVDHSIKLPRPEDHTEDYDRAIQIVEWSEGDEFTVSVREFESFVNDRWSWSDHFAFTNSIYGSSR